MHGLSAQILFDKIQNEFPQNLHKIINRVQILNTKCKGRDKLIPQTND